MRSGFSGHGSAEVEARAGNQTRDEGRGRPSGSDGSVCAEEGLGGAPRGNSEERHGRHNFFFLLEDPG